MDWARLRLFNRHVTRGMAWLGIKGGPGNDLQQRLLDLMWLGNEHIKISAVSMRVMPTVFSDEEVTLI